jgi:transcriptional regulator with XRE-family HTH domain
METNSNSTIIQGQYQITTPASIGEAIRHYRSLAGITQEELSRRTGIRRVYLSEMESGKETEQIKRLLTVLHELGVHVTFEKVDTSIGRYFDLDEYRSTLV